MAVRTHGPQSAADATRRTRRRLTREAASWRWRQGGAPTSAAARGAAAATAAPCRGGQRRWSRRTSTWYTLEHADNPLASRCSRPEVATRTALRRARPAPSRYNSRTRARIPRRGETSPERGPPASTVRSCTRPTQSDCPQRRCSGTWGMLCTRSVGSHRERSGSGRGTPAERPDSPGTRRRSSCQGSGWRTRAAWSWTILYTMTRLRMRSRRGPYTRALGPSSNLASSPPLRCQ